MRNILTVVLCSWLALASFATVAGSYGQDETPSQHWQSLARDAYRNGKYEMAAEYFGEAAATAEKTFLQAKNLYAKGDILLSNTGKTEEGLATLDAVVTRFGDDSDAGVRELAAAALISKGSWLQNAGKSEEGLAVFDGVITRYGDDPNAELQGSVAKALVIKSVVLHIAGKTDEELAVLDTVIKRYGGATKVGVQEWVAKALLVKGTRLSQVTESLAAFDSVVTRYGDAPDRRAARECGDSTACQGRPSAARRKNREGACRL
ncbi:MAG: tetratricopeptide repeat protein [Sideroxyarcus sp.]